MEKRKVIVVVQEREAVKKICPVCHAEFWGTKKKKFDKRECRDLDYYQRHRERRLARQREAYQAEKATIRSGWKK